MMIDLPFLSFIIDMKEILGLKQNTFLLIPPFSLNLIRLIINALVLFFKLQILFIYENLILHFLLKKQ